MGKGVSHRTEPRNEFQCCVCAAVEGANPLRQTAVPPNVRRGERCLRFLSRNCPVLLNGHQISFHSVKSLEATGRDLMTILHGSAKLENNRRAVATAWMGVKGKREADSFWRSRKRKTWGIAE